MNLEIIYLYQARDLLTLNPIGERQRKSYKPKDQADYDRVMEICKTNADYELFDIVEIDRRKTYDVYVWDDEEDTSELWGEVHMTPEELEVHIERLKKHTGCRCFAYLA